MCFKKVVASIAESNAVLRVEPSGLVGTTDKMGTMQPSVLCDVLFATTLTLKMIAGADIKRETIVYCACPYLVTLPSRTLGAYLCAPCGFVGTLVGTVF